ncbi:MAG: biosynthetic-type acetolactate synthase large subunit [Bacteroidetes bacterium]|nr:MAG: biosynthetic-type acetolactate synthase large subunit [Bacteroidota bacterium]TNF00364.1 MAG: biosynthetic-type acetolactate synthase large subunit [Bacteroidota bacterium]
MRGATIVIESLLAEGVETVFGYPGGAIMPVYDALYDYRDRLNHILVRHEQGAIHAAQGFARTSGKPGVCFATSGPGATNLITGLADAMIDSTPVVCITGQVASHLLGTDAFQETDVIGISMPVTKWNIQVTKAEDIVPAIARAFYIAKSGRPGPVLVDITKDAQFGDADFKYEYCDSIRSYQPKPKIDQTLVQQAASLINGAARPYLLVGQGVILSEAEQELMEFVEKAGVPVASTLLGLGAFPADHPQYVGYLGMHGNYAPNVLTNECDVLLAIGMRFDDRVTGDVNRYAKQAKVIHVDLDRSELNKIIPAHIGIHGDAKEVLQLLTPMIEKKNHFDWLEQFRLLQEKEDEAVIRNAVAPDSEELRMAEVIHQLSEIAKRDTVVVTDVGQHQMITSRYYKFKNTRTNVTSGGLGTMGFGLPAAIGAKLGAPEKDVVLVVGDGGIQMTIQEFGTIMQFGIGVKVLLLNNNFLGMVRQWQELFFDRRYSFTDIQNPDFVRIADGYHIPALKVESRKALSEGLTAMLNTEGAFLLEVVVEKEDNVFPMMPTGASVAEVRLS